MYNKCFLCQLIDDLGDPPVWFVYFLPVVAIVTWTAWEIIYRYFI
jgi:hypothetical protein